MTPRRTIVLIGIALGLSAGAVVAFVLILWPALLD